MLIFSALLACCRNENKTPVTEPHDEIAVQESDDTGLGRVIEHVYEGRCTSESGADMRYTLTVVSREHSGDGTFRMEVADCRNPGGESAVYAGKRYTLRGMEGDDDATVWQFVAESGERFNFLYDGNEDMLIRLGGRCEKIAGACMLKPVRE